MVWLTLKRCGRRGRRSLVVHATARPRRATADCDRVVPDSRLSVVASIDGRQGVYTLYMNVLTAPPAIRLPLFHGMGALSCLPGREQRRRAFESPTLSEHGMGNFRAGHRETGRERGRFRGDRPKPDSQGEGRHYSSL